ncbi:FecR domain-containing protein [Lentisphaera profundi]|uniref:FecR domain-containing protein n=1 Tax=Lentisphaera profundi TaxID=1658616 RepID=A0ABY7VWS5_9BACT|nr:LamG-like jellyroll fold domain-containing protein [Lentisphaera profundi]WDE97179.1 FecR domain-containing protein [Lentisphaera profundi]
MTPQQDQLFCRYFDGRLTEKDKNELQELLRKSSEARKKLRMLATVSEGLANHDFNDKALPLITKNSRQNTFIPWTVAAVAIFVACFSWVDSHQPQAKPLDPPDSFIALLVDQAGAEFTDNNAPNGIRFKKGPHQLKNGTIHLRFANGADVVMKAPASFEIEDGFNMRLHHGKIWAMAPPSAQGFTVATPGIDYEDLGTEFTISVDSKTGASQLFVVDGQVDARDPHSKKLLSSVTEGKSLQFTEGKLTHKSSIIPEPYPNPGDIGFLRWELESAEFGKNDPDLIAFYPFNESESLQNEAPHALTSDGQIHGARWVSGRWPNKRALLFDRDSDFVELNIPGEFQELTFSTWIKLDHINHTLNSIFNSNSWDMGDVHWNIHRNGSLSLGYKGARPTTNMSFKTLPTNQWVHLAGTLSKRSGKSCIYINGELTEIRDLETKDSSIKPGLGRIGNWFMGDRKDKAPIRGLRGKIDEFAIWKRSLNQEEIKALVEKGKPSALWSIANQ